METSGAHPRRIVSLRRGIRHRVRVCHAARFRHPNSEGETSYNAGDDFVPFCGTGARVSTAQMDRSLESGSKTVLEILLAISFCHLLNDMISSLLPAIYPLLKDSYHLDFAQVGLLTLTYQLTASLLQPLVGLHTDRRPHPYSLPIGMSFTLTGLVLLAIAPNFGVLLAAASLVGMGSSVFHPESSRVARMASGGRPGLAQSVFQVGGNGGTAIGPILAAFIVLPRGQRSLAWFSLVALIGILVLVYVGNWYRDHYR